MAKSKSKVKEDVVAILTIKGAPKLGKYDRKEINNWLRRQGRAIISQGDEYSDKFTARYIKTDNHA